jgi:hypothetical protein
MDVKLKVLGGAKSGLEIPLKKDLFTIGRSSECSLRAGSDAISRKHCAIRLGQSSISIADLNSRNGTYVNGRRIDQETTLNSGDEVRVGPLRFEVVAEVPADAAAHAPVQSESAAAPRSDGKPGKDLNFEDSIDGWLTAPASDSQVTRETTSLRLDETQGGQVPATSRNIDPASEVEAAAESEAQESTAEVQSSDVLASDSDAEDGSFVRKRKDKKEPGKLPPRPKGPTTKDSREAASEVLRAMTRRR